MRTKLLAAAVGITGLALGAGIGVAAAQDDNNPGRPGGGFETMEEMHASMRDRMPDDLAQACDEMHASMPEEMRDARPGDMGSMPGRSMMGARMMDDDHPGHARWHSFHHPDQDG